MSNLLRSVLSRELPRTSPLPTETPNASPTDSNAVLPSLAGREEELESGHGSNTIPETRAAHYMHKDQTSTSRPGSMSPGATASTDRASHTAELAGKQPELPSTRNFKGKRSKIVRKVKALNPRMVLENSGSVARDHLASERTFLAYVRTSLAIASAGVALVQLFTIADLTSRNAGEPLAQTSREVQKFAKPLGIIAVVFAFIVLVIGMYRYFLIQRALPEQKFPAARLSVAFTTFGLGGVIVVIFAALLKGRV